MLLREERVPWRGDDLPARTSRLVVIAGDPDQATRSGRQVVSPPRYALLSQQHAGEDLVVQRWVRP